jgi:hypothetical protein
MQPRCPIAWRARALAGALLAIVPFGCRSEQASPSPPDAGTTTAKPPRPAEVALKHLASPGDHFSIDYPEEWSAVHIPSVVGGSGPQVEFTAPNALASLNVSHAPMKGSSFEDHMREVESWVTSTMHGKVLEQREITLQDLPGKWLVIDSPPDDNASSGKAHKVLGYYLLKGQTVWRLWCRVEPVLFERYRPLCHQMAESIRFP